MAEVRRSLGSVSAPQLVSAVLAMLVLVGGVVVETGAPVTAQRALAIFCFAVVLWVGQPLPLAISSVLSIILLPVLDVTPTITAAATGFGSRLVFFLLLLFLLGDTIANVDLDEHAAARLRSPGSTPRRSYALLARNVLLLAFVMPSGIARTVTFAPVVKQLNARYDLGDRNNFLRSSFLLLGQLSPIASLALMTGGGMAILSSELIRAELGAISWLDWFVYMAPPVVLLYAISTTALKSLFPVDDLTVTTINDDADTALTPDQKLVAAVIAATIVLWAVGSLVGLSTILPPMLAVTVLAFPGVGIITDREIRGINWGILLLFGAVLSLIEVLTSTGAMDLLVTGLLDAVPLASYPSWLGVAAVVTGVLAVRMLFSTASACLAITLPVAMSLAETLQVDALLLSLTIVIVVGSTTFLPYHLPTVLIAREEYPALRTRDVFLVGLLALSTALVVVTLAWLFYWPLL